MSKNRDYISHFQKAYGRFEKWVDKSLNRLRLASVFSFLLFSVFLFKVNLSDRVDVQYGSDEWDYQAIAVNFATGHGFHIAGHYEKPEVYKFGQVEPGTFEKQELLKGIPNIHRPPLYPLVLGVVYKIAGIHPSAVVILQLFLLCLAAASLPLLGFKLLKTKGFIAGLMSAAVFISFNYKMAEIFLPGQAFTVFFICAFIYVTEHFFRKRTPLAAGASACILGISLLFHATMILVAGFIGIYLIFSLFRQNNKYEFLNLSVYICVLLLVLLPWHLYAYKTLHILKKEAAVTLSLSLDSTRTVEEKAKVLAVSAPHYGLHLMPQRTFSQNAYKVVTDSLLPATRNKGAFFNNIDSAGIDFFRVALLQEILDAPDYFPVFLSITKNMAMDCHNEYITLHQPIQTWRIRPESYYNNDGRNGRISFIRVFYFYRDNPGLIVPLLLYKINVSLRYSTFLKLFFLLCFFLFIIEYYRQSKYKLIPALILGAVIAVLIIAGQNWLTLLLLIIYILLSIYYARATQAIFRVPLSFNYVFFTLLIFSVIAMGNQRYFEVLNLFFVFFTFIYLLRIAEVLAGRKR